MSRPALLIVTGKPATGKTTLALRLSRDLSALLIHKDAIKEALFDGLGTGDRAWSRKLGVASYRVIYALAEVLLSCGQSLILESNFSAHHDASQLVHMTERFGAVLAQIYLTCDPDVLVERFERRAGGSERHPATSNCRIVPNFGRRF